MKHGITRLTALVLSAVITIALFSCYVVYPSTQIFGYSDPEYYVYANIDGAINVPTIFRQDSGFANDNRFPLIIQNSIEYVPLEIFLGFSGVIVDYPEEANGFYIFNKNRNMYISFDMSTGYAVSSTKGAMYLETKIFYDVIYVPMRATTAEVGLFCETYVDRIRKLYCVRVFDENAVKTTSELVDEYLSRVGVVSPPDEPPIIFPDYPTPPSDGTFPDEPDLPINPDDPNSSEDTPETSPEGGPAVPPGIHDEFPDELPPETIINEEEELRDELAEQEKEEERAELAIGRRDIYLTFTSSPNKNTEAILNVLARYGVKATFFCNARNMIAYPGLVRRMIVDGHHIGICPGEKILSARTLYDLVVQKKYDSSSQTEDNVEQSVEETAVTEKDALADILNSQRVLERLTKGKAMLMYVPTRLSELVDTDSVCREAGVFPVTPNIETADHTDATRVRIAAQITDYLWNMLPDSVNGTGSAIILFNSTEKTADSLVRLLDFASTRPQIRVKLLSDAVDISSLGLEYRDN